MAAAADEPYKLLASIDDDDEGITLQIRLVHAWNSFSPSDPARFFNFCSLWCDESGDLIQGTAASESSLGGRIRVGSIYVVTGFDLQAPSENYRACGHRLTLALAREPLFI